MSPAAEVMLQTQEVSCGYRGGACVLHELHFRAVQGKLLCLLGPNGSGKTTLLRCLLGQLRPQSGRVLLQGRPLRSYRPRRLARLLAYVPQTASSAFAFSVEELVLMGRFAHAGTLGLASRQDLAVAHEAMKMTETLAFAGRSLDELSGGEAQRVMIARALAQQPAVMLLDEPTSHLDVYHQLKIYRMMQRLAHDWGMAVVCVSHDVNLAGRFADELALMRAGRMVAAGTPADVLQPDLLQQTYDVQVELVKAPGSATPLVWAH